MKTLTRLAFALLCVAVAVHGANLLVGEGDEADCAQYTLPMCSRNYEPVCGSDGVTYSNECMLCFDNSERKVNVLIKKKGKC